MRIIHGRYRGFQFPPFHGEHTRPSSDLVKESLFNTLESHHDLEGNQVLDLFAGTGNIGLECLSRGAGSLLSIDHMSSNIRYMQGIRRQLNVEHWDIRKADALRFVQENTQPFDLVFADPPYHYAPIHEMVNQVLQSAWFAARPCVFVLEHVDRLVFKHKEVFLNKQYGNTSFTCFRSESSKP